MATLSKPPSRRTSHRSHWRRLNSRAVRKGRIGISRNEVPRLAKPAGREWTEHAFGFAPAPRWKRATDIVLIVLFLPLVLMLALAVCAWIKGVSPGNVLFRQTRVGRGGRAFTIYKFRTMKLMAETAVHEHHVEELIKANRPMLKLDLCGDSRLIKGGCMIRMAGLDELPQLVNILRGEMSLVGPRPCTPCEFPLYDPDDYLRFTVQPGLTGLWQVARTGSTTFRAMVAMDIEYVRRLSPWMDLRILARTPVSVMRQLEGYLRLRMSRRPVRRVSPHAGRRLAGFPASQGSTANSAWRT